MYKLFEEITVKAPLEEIWNFIATPANLNKITPSDMSFEIVSKVPDEMYNGLILEYRVKIPIVGNQRWISEIKHISPFKRFVDEQIMGPYKFWYHEHIVEAISEDKTKMIDQVFYQLPFGIFGKIAHPIFVAKQLNKIFTFRRKSMANIFGIE